MGRILVLITAAVLTTVAAPAPATAEEPGCERVVTYGLNPQLRRICDGPMQPDGWWARARQFWAPAPVGDYCQRYGFLIEDCPPAIRGRGDGRRTRAG